MKLLLLTRSLEAGGAERQLACLARALQKKGVQVHVATFYSGGRLENEVKSTAGLELHHLDKAGRWDLISLGWRFRLLLNKHRFQAVYSFQRGPNIVALLGKTVKERPLIVWGVRFSQIDLRPYCSMTRRADRVESWLAPLPDRVIVNSQAGIEHCQRNGFPGHKLVHIPNGIDTSTYAAQPCARKGVRRQLGLEEGAPLIGLVARIDHVKGHRTFLEAAIILHRRAPEAHFLCVGGVSAGMESLHHELLELVRTLRLEGVVHWTGYQSDIGCWTSALDVATSSSLGGEGFSNSVGEAMACEVPCVVTNVGDSPRIVGDTGWVVPPGDPAALANAWEQVLALPSERRREIGRRARRRVTEEFSVDRMSQATLEVLRRD